MRLSLAFAFVIGCSSIGISGAFGQAQNGGGVGGITPVFPKIEGLNSGGTSINPWASQAGGIGDGSGLNRGAVGLANGSTIGSNEIPWVVSSCGEARCLTKSLRGQVTELCGVVAKLGNAVDKTWTDYAVCRDIQKLLASGQ